jgi:hypothetical protein
MTSEDYTTYTEVDPSTHITVGAGTITAILCRDLDERVFKDMGADYFGSSFTIEMDFSVTEIGGNALGIVWCLSNYVDDHVYLRANKDYYAIMTYRAGATTTMYIEEKALPAAYHNTTIVIADATQYWLRIVKSGTSLVVNIFTDSGRTTHLSGSPKTLTVTDNKFQYLFACNSYNSGLVNATATYVISNLDILTYFRTISDTLGLAEILSGTHNLAIPDVLQLTESHGGQIGFKASDTFQLTESQSGSVGMAISDGLHIVESIHTFLKELAKKILGHAKRFIAPKEIKFDLNVSIVGVPFGVLERTIGISGIPEQEVSTSISIRGSPFIRQLIEAKILRRKSIEKILEMILEDET